MTKKKKEKFFRKNKDAIIVALFIGTVFAIIQLINNLVEIFFTFKINF